MPKAKYSHDLPPSLRRMQLSVPWSDTLRPRASVASWGLAFERQFSSAPFTWNEPLFDLRTTFVTLGAHEDARFWLETSGPRPRRPKEVCDASSTPPSLQRRSARPCFSSASPCSCGSRAWEPRLRRRCRRANRPSRSPPGSSSRICPQPPSAARPLKPTSTSVSAGTIRDSPFPAPSRSVSLRMPPPNS